MRRKPDKLGIYFHIPFCRSKCDYCDFYSLAGRDDAMDLCQRALLAHLKETAFAARSCEVDTVYFGGGTPSYYGAKRLRELLAAVKKHYRVARNAEVTFEANPDSAGFKTLRTLRRAGFNRVSLGMQSACPAELEAVHRPHTPAQTDEAVAAARKARLGNLSLDLIYGLPGQTMASWQETVEHSLSLAPEHLSCYGLKVEEGTPLAARVRRGESLPEDDTQADLYLWAVERLARAGYEQYEISNFARPGFASRHNLRYWNMEPYIGFGPGAHSDFGGRRYLIPQEERGSEYLMLRLRTALGIEEWEYRGRYFMDFSPIQERLEHYRSQGWAEKTAAGRWRLTPRGFLVSNQLIVELLERQEKARLAELLPKAQARYQGKK